MASSFEQACREVSALKARYFRMMDTKDFDGLDTLFRDDARIDVRGAVSDDKGSAVDALSGEGGLMTGVEFRHFLRETLPPLLTVHHGHMPEFRLLSPERIEATWAMEDRIWFPPGGAVQFLHGWGHYHDVYLLEPPGQWVFASMSLTRLGVEMR